MELMPNIQEYISFFDDYYNSFKNLNAEQQKNFKIKKDHSFRVAELTNTLAVKQGLGEDLLPLAFCAGLFHDIGRFQQFNDFETFDDNVSTDHAALSVEVIGAKGALSGLGKENEEAVHTAIFHHNKFDVPKNLGVDSLTLARLLRDADKLDILNVLCDYYENKKGQPNHTLTWDLPNGLKISEDVAKVILNRKPIQKQIVKNKIDLKVFQMSWVFDLNYKASFRILAQKRYIERIYDTLPKSEKIIEFYRGIKIYIENSIS